MSEHTGVPDTTESLRDLRLSGHHSRDCPRWRRGLLNTTTDDCQCWVKRVASALERLETLRSFEPQRIRMIADSFDEKALWHIFLDNLADALALAREEKQA